MGTLCSKVLAAAKEQPETLAQISMIAQRGYLSHGKGAVKCFFPCPEAAEKLLSSGQACLGELTYMRWTDLLPSDMGLQMYTEIVKMCHNYNPKTRLVLYVTVCVVSEAPTTGAAKWERQLVSRCAKMRLSKETIIPEPDLQNLETLLLTCGPSKENLYKEIVFAKIQTELKVRGVSLWRQYPEVYQQLCLYVDGKNKQSVTITIFPQDDVTGKIFMCIIMLDCDPDDVKQVCAAGGKLNVINLPGNCRS